MVGAGFERGLRRVYDLSNWGGWVCTGVKTPACRSRPLPGRMDLRVMGRRDVGQKPFPPQSAQTRKSTVFSTPYAGIPLHLCAFYEIAVQFSTTFHSNSQLFPVPIRQIAPLEKLSPPISATIGANICAKSQPLRRTFAACCGTIRANIPDRRGGLRVAQDDSIFIERTFDSERQRAN